MINVKKIIRKSVRELNVMFALMIAAVVAGGLGTASYVLASATSSFTQVINPGTLSVDIVDGSYSPVGSPSVAMNPVTFSFACQNSTGSFGTASQAIYVKNPDAADNGWSVTLGAPSTSFWNSAGTKMDFNDPAESGCGDGAGDADSYKGQMSVDPSGASLSKGQCLGCVATNIAKGSAGSFDEATPGDITLLTGAAGSDDIGDWKLTNVAITQKIPAEQPAASDYSINLTLSIAAS
jgi:hypothetical protein